MQRSKRRFLFPLCLQLLSYSAYFTRCKPRFYADVDSTLCPKTASNCRTRVKYRLVKRLDQEALELATDPDSSEFTVAQAEESIAEIVDLHLPEERLRIGDLLSLFPIRGRPRRRS